MANNNVFSCDAGTFTIDQAIEGQTPLVMYDSLKQAALLPELRSLRSGMAQVIMPWDERTPEALFSQMQAAFGSENRTVAAREFFWLEYDNYDTMTFVVDAASSVPAPGQPVTVNIDPLNVSVTGNFTKPLEGYYAWVKELNRQLVIISAVNKTGDTVTLTPVNGEQLNLVGYARYTIIIDPLRRYVLGTQTNIPTEGFVLNPPVMYKAYAQTFEKGIAINQDEINNYVYNRDFKVLKGLNTRGEEVEFFYLPAVHGQLEAFIQDNMNMNTLFGRRDNGNQIGFDGIVPTAYNYGMFNSGYDIFSNVSLKQILFGMIKTLRRVNGCNEYMLAHDFGFWEDWSESIGQLITASSQSYRYALFGDGGVGSRDFSYYDFRAFEAFGYKFTPYMLDVLDHRRYGNILEYFALLMPLAKFKDQKGTTVPFITYCYIEGAEPAKVRNIWDFDFRLQGGRTYNVYLSTTWGMEVHAPTRLGILTKQSTA